MTEAEIIQYDNKYKDSFKKLNIEWLQKYFVVEPEDEKVLSHPEEIINKGGMIFFAVYNEEIVGTCAAIKNDDNTFELAKMAVTEKAQGKKIGEKLAIAVLDFSVSNKADAIVLETATKLTAAVGLYKKMGFKDIPFDNQSKYQRTTVKMKLDLLR